MKLIKVFTVLFISCFMLCSCENIETDFEHKQLQLIDFEPNEPFESQIVVIEIAKDRLNGFVSFKDGQYVMEHCVPEDVGLSKTVFDYMVYLMECQNEEIKKYNHLPMIEGKRLVNVGEISSITRSVSRSENSSDGSTYFVVEQNWYGNYIYVYISNSDLRKAGYTTSIAAAALEFFKGTTITAYISAACGLASITCHYWADNYPRGVKISILQLPNPVGCIPYDVCGQ